MSSPEKMPRERPREKPRVLDDYEKALIWKMYEIFRGPDEEARLRKVAELTEWDLETVKAIVAEGPRPWVATPPIVRAVPRKKIRTAEEIFAAMGMEEMMDLSEMSIEKLENLKRAIDNELRRRGYLT